MICKGFIPKIGLLAILLSAAWLPVYPQQKDITADLLDGILAGMTDGNNTAAVDNVCSDNLISSIADIMAIDRTLAYMDNAFSYSTPNPLSFKGDVQSLPWLRGNMVLPVEGRVTSNFGYRPSFGRMHYGIDLHLQIGDTVRAAGGGVVSRVKVDPPGYGLYVVILHDDELETRYAHLSRSLVNVGDRVFAGDAIGLGGSTGNSTGPHLHFETRRGGEAFDPRLMFNFGQPYPGITNRSLSRLDESYRSERGNIDRRADISTSSQPDSDARSSSVQEKRTYVVKTGDTIVSVAAQAGISTLTLCRLNMLSSTDTLKPGTMLRLR